MPAVPRVVLRCSVALLAGRGEFAAVERSVFSRVRQSLSLIGAGRA